MSSPAIAVATHAQNGFLTLLILTVCVTFWRQRRAMLSGVIAGLLLYKPQHAMIIALALVVSLGWRAAAGFAMTGAALLVITILTMPGAAGDYVHKLPRMLQGIQELTPYAWNRHVTFKAFWRFLFQGTNAGPSGWAATLMWWVSEVVGFGVLAVLAAAARRRRELTDKFIAAAIVAGPLLAPFCFDYDLIVLAVPGALVAADAMRNGCAARAVWAWVALYIVLHVSPPLAPVTRVIWAVPALCVVLGMIFAETRGAMKLPVGREKIGEMLRALAA